jgi:hypothetical protein
MILAIVLSILAKKDRGIIEDIIAMATEQADLDDNDEQGIEAIGAALIKSAA